MFFRLSNKIDQVIGKQALLLSLVTALIKQGPTIMSAIDDLKAALADNTSAVQEDLAELSDLVNQVNDGLKKIAAFGKDLQPDDSAELKGITDQIRANTKAMKDGIASAKAGVQQVADTPLPPAVDSVSGGGDTISVGQGAMGSGVTVDPAQSIVAGDNPASTTDNVSASTIGVPPEQATDGATAPKEPDAEPLQPAPESGTSPTGPAQV